MSNMYKNVKTWNPIDGECPHGCKYCAVQKIFNRKLPGVISKYSGELRLNEKEMKRNLGKGKTWFICGVGNDLFADGVDFGWIDRILERCYKYPENKYYLQTKNAENMEIYMCNRSLPDNFHLGITLESNYALMHEYGGGNQFFYRIGYFSQIKHAHKYITIEPIMQFNLDKMVEVIRLCSPEMVYIGANTLLSKPVPEPSKEEILELITELEKFTTVIQKSNLKRLLL